MYSTLITCKRAFTSFTVHAQEIPNKDHGGNKSDFIVLSLRLMYSWISYDCFYFICLINKKMPFPVHSMLSGPFVTVPCVGLSYCVLLHGLHHRHQVKFLCI